MCGIAGIIDFENYEIKQERLIAMSECLKHRGPDGDSNYLNKNIGVCHRRLAIIDLSIHGQQPMVEKKQIGELVISFNGEIYNHKELRVELQQKGHNFKSFTDTEVILKGFIEFGNSIWSKLEGFFAVAIWDTFTEKLVLARDSLGIKPLFYYSKTNTIVFGSEIKSILASGQFDASIDPISLSDYFSYFYVPGPKTIIKDVHQVMPGNFIEFSNQGSIIRQFWKLEINKKNCCSSYSDHEAHIREEVSIAIKSSLVADVPISLLLSGGLDSHIIMSELISLGIYDIEPITLGFEEKAYDESSIVLHSTKKMGIKPNIIRLNNTNCSEFFDQMITHSDFLNANFANLAEYQIFEEVSKKSKVVLTGMGLDELFAGYKTYQADVYMQNYKRFTPNFMKNTPLHFIPKLDILNSKYPINWTARKFFEASNFGSAKSHYWFRTIFSDWQKSKLFSEDFKAKLGNYDSFSPFSFHYDSLDPQVDSFDRILFADLNLFCIDNANLLMDAMSMRHGVESRPPFLSKRFVEFAFSLPSSQKFNKGIGKVSLRNSYKNLIPPRVLNGKKTGLVSPISRLLKSDLKDILLETVNEMSDYTLLNRKEVVKMTEIHLSGKADFGFELYLILVYLRWRKLIFEKYSGKANT